jgi:SAM-dependent methyltransferase
MEFLKSVVGRHEVADRAVLEVGSGIVNGTPRTVIMPMLPKRYVGVDAAPGPGVDLVVDAKDLVQVFGEGVFDLVIATELLEHVRDWRVTVSQMKRVLATCGNLIVTTRSPGFPYHAYPEDHWRYTLSDFEKIFDDLHITTLALDPGIAHPGVFLKAWKWKIWMENDLSKIEVAKAPTA